MWYTLEFHLVFLALYLVQLNPDHNRKVRNYNMMLTQKYLLHPEL